MEKLTEMPFLTAFMRFSSAVLYVDPRCNAFQPFVDEELRRELGNKILQQFSFSSTRNRYDCFGAKGNSDMNAMAIYFGCTIDNGFTRFLNARGDAFFIGTTAKKQPVTSNILWGASNFLRDAMRYYPDIEQGIREENFRKWGRQYLCEKWQPVAGDKGVNLYQTNPFECAIGWSVVDHRRG
ncbi:hypothetical protein PHMEG_0001001 [Phytophthora megakarya]|uniref:Uncharacterized protein n=1 Tax=Phytophthora megakarya TaxID=4795 RepID=A0A225X464_9STRA|nr:hypothetical protein PHMEG_0001001 [Phytophthora megakarya]